MAQRMGHRGEKREEPRRERRIGILGGTFDPIHLGHLILAEHAREALALDRFCLLPAGEPPHKRAEDLAPAADRLAMVRLACRENPAFDALDLEVRRQGTTYTVDTLRALQRDRPGAEIFFLIGADSVPELPTWREADALFGLTHFVTVRRRGFAGDVFAAVEGRFPAEVLADLRRHALDSPVIEISSTDIRARTREGRSIRYLVPEPVRAYIDERRLYTAGGAPGNPRGGESGGPFGPIPG